MVIPDPLPPLFRPVLKVISRIGTELLYVGSSWSSYICSSMWREYITYEFITYELVLIMYGSTSLMSSSLLLKQCLTLLVRLTWIVLWWVVSGRTAVDLWSAASMTGWIWLAAFLCSCRQVFHHRFFSVHTVHPYSSINTTAVRKKLRFIWSVSSCFHMTGRLSIAVHAFASRMLMSVSVDETLLSSLGNLSTSSRELPFIIIVYN